MLCRLTIKAEKWRLVFFLFSLFFNSTLKMGHGHQNNYKHEDQWGLLPWAVSKILLHKTAPHKTSTSCALRGPETHYYLLQICPEVTVRLTGCWNPVTNSSWDKSLSCGKQIMHDLAYVFNSKIKKSKSHRNTLCMILPMYLTTKQRKAKVMENIMHDLACVFSKKTKQKAKSHGKQIVHDPAFIFKI